MGQVYPAKPYSPGCLGSLDRTSYMCLRQFQFPDTFDSQLDKHMTADSDRVSSWDFNHAMNCYKKHTGTGDMGLERWIRSASDESIMAFLKEILKADDDKVQWTGYRIMGSVHQGNGYPIWTLELFAKSEESNTNVYSDENAPNVRGEKPEGFRWR